MQKISIIILLSVVAFTCRAQTDANTTALIEKLSAELIDNYIFEDKALSMAEKIQKNLKSGHYNELEGAELANQLQKDLRSVVNDKHLRIQYGYSRSSSKKRRDIPRYPDNISPVKLLENRIGYFEITGFKQPDASLRKTMASTMEQLMDVDAIIIDMRNNGGGSPAAVQLICSYFFSESPVHLNSLYFRNRDQMNDFYTLEDLDGPRFPDKPLYLLTSDYTFSGGEEFVYNLKNLKRATLIGEITGGGAHPVNGYPLINNFRATIPIGRAISPITKTNWEGVGVIPHVKVDESKALDKALEMITK